MNQPDLFQSHPRARRRDPATSHLAALDVTESGRANEQAETVMRVLAQRPGLCSIEIPDYCDLDRYQVARRLPELERDGRLRRGAPRMSPTGRLAVTWWPTT